MYSYLYEVLCSSPLVSPANSKDGGILGHVMGPHTRVKGVLDMNFYRFSFC